MKKNIYKFIFAMALSLLFADKLMAAASDSLPEMMVGQTTFTDSNGKITYGGMTGNYAVYNADATMGYGFKKELLILGGTNACLSADPICFILGTGPLGEGSAGKNSRLMTSRTSVDVSDGKGFVDIYELPALFLGTNIITGDTYGSIDYSKFSFWGNNMSTQKGSGSTDALWNLKNYTLNSGSQSAWLDPITGKDTPAFTQYYDKVTKLAANATIITDAQITSIKAGSHIYLQSSNIMNPATDQSTQYPEGKTWIIGHDLILDTPNKTITYHGKGTIIVKGNITLADGVKIKTDPVDLNAKLGIMSITK